MACETPSYCDPIIVAGAAACTPPACGSVELSDPLWRTVRLEDQMRAALAQIGNINRLIADIQRSLFQGSSPSSLQNQINALGVDVAAAEVDIAASAALGATNAADIATNTADIATNVADIATNAADIATNVADIATNGNDIATNAADIITNAGLISTNANDINQIETRLADETYGGFYISAGAASAAITPTTYLNVLANATILTSGFGADFTIDTVNRRLTYTGATTKDFVVSAALSFTVSSNSLVARFRFSKNGTTAVRTEIARKVGTGTDVGALALQGFFSLATNDYIDLHATLDSGAADTITVTKGNILVRDLLPGT